MADFSLVVLIESSRWKHSALVKNWKLVEDDRRMLDTLSEKPVHWLDSDVQHVLMLLGMDSEGVSLDRGWWCDVEEPEEIQELVTHMYIIQYNI
jgi:hypothetical protein